MSHIHPSLHALPSFEQVPGLAVVLRDFRLGGSERVAIGLANFWSSLGIPVFLCVGRGQGPLRELVCASIRIIDGGLSPDLDDHRLIKATARFARQYLSTHPVASCYIPGNSHWPVVPWLTSLPAPLRPVLVAQVSSPVHRPSRKKPAQFCYDLRMRFLLRRADHVTTLSQPLMEQTRAILGGRRVELVPLPALWDEGAPCAVTDGQEHIVAAGRLVPVKGFDILIRAFALVAVSRPHAHLTLCGDGPERAALLDLIETLGLSNRVHLVGYVPSIRPYLDSCRVFVMSSHCESFGAVLIEALSAGRQVVSTRCSPAVDEIVTCDMAGRTVDVGDPVGMAAAIESVLSGPAPSCDALESLVRCYHVAHGGRIFLNLLRRPKSDKERPAVRRDKQIASF